MRRLWLALMITVVLASCAGAQARIDAAVAATVAAHNLPTAVHGGWREIARFNGRADKTTETVPVPVDEWRIVWETAGHPTESFYIQVWRIGGAGRAFIGGVTGPASDYSVMHQAGEFYLTISAAAPYTITIEVPD